MIRPEPSFVYFLRPVGMDGPVKIGCSIDPRGRLMAYANWAPWRLELAAAIPGDQTLERRFHARFLADRMNHEWFAASEGLTETILAIAEGRFDPSSLPEPKMLPPRFERQPWPAEARYAASLSHRMRHAERRGAKVPRDVWEAYRRFAWGKNPRYGAAEAKVIEDFLAQHPAPARRKRAA